MNIYLLIVLYNIYLVLKQPGLLVFGEQFLPVFLLSLMMFIYFKGINIKYNKTINSIASISFGVYLFHDNDFFRETLWKNILHVKYFYNVNPIILILHIVLSVVIIYCLTYILEFIRKKLFKLGGFYEA